MVLAPFERISAENMGLERDLGALQDRIEQFTNKLVAQPGLDSILYEAVTITSGVENILEHGLGRQFRGFRVTDSDVPVTVFPDNSTNSHDETRFLVLNSTADCVVDIEVY